MRIVLKEFQDNAVYKLVRYMRAASREARDGELQSVGLSSTTGSGKTVMLTRAVELILEGDDDHPPMTDATFLWITDDPQLNEQTRKKMQATSSVLKTEHLIVIDASFDAEALQPGAVHFLNIQKIGKEKTLVTPGDKRTYSFWETVRNTAEARPGRFFVIVDEAHRGMSEEGAQEEAASIVQKFIKGSPGELAPVPMVVGISATPERYNRLIGGTNRTQRSVDIDVGEVRDSGLIKETIVLHRPKLDQPTDMTLLREAARALKRSCTQWAAYCAAQEDYTVKPLLVIQVEDANVKGSISATDIAQCLQILRDELGTLPSDAFAHSFQEGTSLKVGGDDLRYLAPSDIESDSDIVVVFFKTSLNTGWDCPRAEVMMSFRRAADATYIAQLVGRMVRAPLARRIVDFELLNTVPLYLPHYDANGLKRIIDKLSKPDDGTPSVDVETGDNVVGLVRATGSDSYFEKLSTLPSYIVPRRRKVNQVRRLMRFARLLTNDEIDADAVTSARDTILGIINGDYEQLKDTDKFKEVVQGKREVEIEAVNWDVGAIAGRDGDVIKVNIASENVDDLFEACGRKLNEGLHKAWWKDQVSRGSKDHERTKLELFALCSNSTLIKRIERASQELVQKWLTEHKLAIAKRDEGSRSQYNEIRNLAASPELAPLVYPQELEARPAETSWGKHLYINSEGTFEGKFNAPEEEVLRREIGASEVVAWLRNTDRKPWALCVPYEVGGEDRAMYPDFLVVRSQQGQLVADIIDPHAISLADAPAKAAGLARFAAKHADAFGRIELIMVQDKVSKVFDLTNELVRRKVQGLKHPDEMKRLFEES